MQLASHLCPLLTFYVKDYVGELAWLRAADECAVMQHMIEEVGVSQYDYMHSFGLL